MSPLANERLTDPRHAALVELGRGLQRHGYRFVSITPATHARVLARAVRSGRVLATDLRDVFGWNLPFVEATMPADLLALLCAAGSVHEHAGALRSTVRFSTLGERLFVHSAFPTEEADAVFFGPDTYRFAAFLRRNATPADRLVDIGCGGGAGGLVLADRAQRIVLADVNPKALAFAAINAKLAGIDAQIVHSDVLRGVAGEADLVIANPPYIADAHSRTYRDGGGTWGEGLAVRIVEESLPRLVPGGRLLVYTGAPIVAGQDVFLAAITPALQAAGASFEYDELDPDVFGEELDGPGYAQVDRIAVVGLCATLR